jgi:hypothetical protein
MCQQSAGAKAEGSFLILATPQGILTIYGRENKTRKVPSHKNRNIQK